MEGLPGDNSAKMGQVYKLLRGHSFSNSEMTKLHVMFIYNL